MSRVLMYRGFGVAGFYGFLASLAIVAQLRGGTPIHAEVGPVELAEVGFMALLAGLCLAVVFSTDVGAVWRWLAAAMVLFAASGVNDLIGFTAGLSWIEPFDDVSSILSWLGSASMVGAAFRLPGVAKGARLLVAAGFALHQGMLFTELAAAMDAMSQAGDSGLLNGAAEVSELVTYATYTTGLTLLVWGALSPAPAVTAEAPGPTAASYSHGGKYWPWPLQTVAACDLCGSGNLAEVVAATPVSCRIEMCNDCGLLFSSPMIHAASLDRYFSDGFEGDPGTTRRMARDDSMDRKAAREETIALDWALPLVTGYLDLEGKSVLDIRSRTGSLARAMSVSGADVIGLDPLKANVASARKLGGGVEFRLVPIVELGELSGIADESFDVVTELTVHLLGHLPSPRRHLERVFRVLRPGGLLFIDEKHALRPARTAKSALFGDVPVHSYHFTDRTIARYLEETGFEVLECGPDSLRASAFRHLRVVARKPLAGMMRGRPVALTESDRAALRSEIAGAMRQLGRVRQFNRARRMLKRLLRSLPF